MLKKIVIWNLKIFAKIILNKYKPKVIGITGSVGKTGAREAIFSVLKNKFRTRRSLKNYNNEFGLPISIIGAKKSPGKNLYAWIFLFLYAAWLIIFKDKNYPEVLILEMGVDKPGDMDYLNNIVSLDFAVLTGVGESHLENFSSKDKLAAEKGKIFKALKKGAWAIFNSDNEAAVSLVGKAKNKILSYGMGEEASVKGDNIVFKFKGEKKIENLIGQTFKVFYKGSMVPVSLSFISGRPAVYSSLAAIAVALNMGLNLAEVALALSDFRSSSGRMSVVKGIKKSIIIDDTYNASPESCLAAIDMVDLIEAAESFRKIAILGDMLELGSYSEEGHRLVGRALAKAGFDLLVTSGERSRDINRGALEVGMSEDKVFNFANNLAAGKFFQDRIKKGDLILVKGSQGARMEKVVKELMADPLSAEKVLCRQGKEWNS